MLFSKMRYGGVQGGGGGGERGDGDHGSLEGCLPMYGHTYGQSMDRPGKVAKSCTWSAKQGKWIFPCPRSCLRIWSRKNHCTCVCWWIYTVRVGWPGLCDPLLFSVICPGGVAKSGSDLPWPTLHPYINPTKQMKRDGACFGQRDLCREPADVVQ